MTTMPPQLRLAYEAWLKENRPAQRPSTWNPKTWRRALPEYESVFHALGDSVDRAEAVKWAERVDDPRSAAEAFVVAMIWGFGPVGYGAFRTARVLDGTGAEENLLAIAQTVRESGGIAAYATVGRERAKSRSFLKHLGPSFGTKYIYFLSKAAGRPTPVMDAVVQRWCRTTGSGLRINLDWADSAGYERYVSTLEEWGKELGSRSAPLPADDVEYLIFTGGAEAEGLPWREPWAAAVSDLAPRDLLDALAQHLDHLGLKERATASLQELEALLPQEGDT